MTKEYPIKISPEILELLGPSLYTNIYYVLAELVANSYDADAENVWITFSESKIVIEDDGKGMSYEDTINKYLSVAKPTRVDETNSTSEKYQRPKMGRKGIGKLAALAVSSKAKVMTKVGNDISGFWLTRAIPSNGKLEPIPDSEIIFENISSSGTRIEMLGSEFEIPVTARTIKNNLLKFFPQLSNDKANPFAIHINRDGKVEHSAQFVDSLANSLDSLILIGKDEYGITKKFEEKAPKYALGNFLKKDEIQREYSIKNKDGEQVERVLKVKGWIATYSSTKGLKEKKSSDFPDNFLAIYSHGKLGQFSILNEIGENRLNEVYVVGQLFVDEFEDTSLPDMALSNRQGYKNDDVRYKLFLKIASELLKDILKRKDSAIKAKKKNSEKTKRQKKQKAEEEFVTKAQEALKMFNDAVPDNNLNPKVANDMFRQLGMKKAVVDSDVRKILLSHTRTDEKINNTIYKLLLFNGFNEDEIIYTSDPDGKSSVPYGMKVYEYLREFFVKSYSDKTIYVLYIYSDNSANSPGVLQEIGAGWIVQNEHGIIKAGLSKPEEPLNIETLYPSLCLDSSRKVVVTTQNHFNVLYQLLERTCVLFDKEIKPLKENKDKFLNLDGEIISEEDFKNILENMR
ncbi:hypothetical protein BOVMAS03_16390 [Streptococcus uberis]|uniref:ATP-binding protein n=1 Tax=Streptococcus uberis TaxID=1349 RepID=UPI00334146C4